MTETRELLVAIMDGEHDDQLDVLSNAIRERMKAKRDRDAQITAMLLKKGDRVTMKGLSPKFLNDEIVEVVEVKQKRVAVKAIEEVTGLRAAQRIGFHGGCTVPLTCVEVVEAAVTA